MKKIVATLSICLLPLLAQATLPVIDYSAVANLIKQYQQLQKQYALLQQGYALSQQQLNMAKQIANGQIGHYGFGQYLNSAEDLKRRQWSPDRWEDALQGLSGGNPARYRELVEEYQHSHEFVAPNQYARVANTQATVNYVQASQTNQAASVQATYSFNEINDHLKTIHDLTGQIEKTENMKSAMDLNSRIQAELAYVSVQELKMQTLMNQQMAQSQSNELVAQSESAKFKLLPDE